MSLTIAWDLDDVLQNFIEDWLKYWNSSYSTDIKYEDILVWDMTKNLNCSNFEVGECMDSFKINGYYHNLKPNKEILEWFEKHGHKFNHIVITASSLITSNISAEWVMRNYGKWIRTFVCIPSQREGETIPKYDSSKKDYLTRTSCANIFIDDNPITCMNVSQYSNIKTFCRKQPWNKGISMIEILENILKIQEDYVNDEWYFNQVNY